MVFKINVSHNGKTLKIETESEALIRSKIGDKISGSTVDPSLDGYELEITGTSDASGFPGVKGQIGTQLRGALLSRNQTGMRNERKGLRLKKSVRGEEISEKTVQINIKVLKEGSKKFDTLVAKPAEGKEAKEGEEAKPAEGETPKEEAKEEAAADQEPKQDKPSGEPDPEEEPKTTEKDKKELANPEEEPTS